MKLKCTCVANRGKCIDCMEDYIERAEANEEHNKYMEKNLIDLLCLIHEDGGHYIIEHGIEKAVKDGIKKVRDLTHGN